VWVCLKEYGSGSVVALMAKTVKLASLKRELGIVKQIQIGI